MSGQDIILEFREKRIKLIDTVVAMKKIGRELARAENEYRKELAKKMLLERANGMPVTIISDICRGDEKIADLKLKRDIAQSDYDVSDNMQNALKIEIRILENEINRELGRG